jgi:hypothetical protein
MNADDQFNSQERLRVASAKELQGRRLKGLREERHNWSI